MYQSLARQGVDASWAGVLATLPTHLAALELRCCGRRKPRIPLRRTDRCCGCRTILTARTAGRWVSGSDAAPSDDSTKFRQMLPDGAANPHRILTTQAVLPFSGAKPIGTDGVTPIEVLPACKRCFASASIGTGRYPPTVRSPKGVGWAWDPPTCSGTSIEPTCGRSHRARPRPP